MVLYIPYFPYARQDKATTDESTFARSTFVDMIDLKFDTIITSDIHSPLESDYCEFIDEKPTQYIKSAIIDFNTDILVFPDAGAYFRYGEIFHEYNYIVLDKVRNQLTGKIYLKPTRSLEFIEIEFNIMNTGASFDNI